MIWSMLPGDAVEVQLLAHLCRPDRPSRPKEWYLAHPTLVKSVEDRIVGFTSYTVTLIPGFGETMYGQDVCVHPLFRGRGIARELHAARLMIARLIGVKTFMGTTHPDNKAMVRILEASGMHRCIQVGEDALFVGPIQEV